MSCVIMDEQHDAHTVTEETYRTFALKNDVTTQLHLAHLVVYPSHAEFKNILFLYVHAQLSYCHFLFYPPLVKYHNYSFF